ncbi:MAG: hypothetical protein H5T34_04300 [Candidatus Methanomethyliales bacterium]|nr:hypothetical protein [Candidatus Methanomethylicales archaeon]
MSSGKVYVYLYIPKEVAEWLKHEANKERRSFNNYVSLLLEDYYQRRRREALCTSQQS